jgi:polysaccharide export outer membrane protein
VRGSFLAIALVALAGALAVAAEEPAPDGARRLAEIHIRIPAGEAPNVSLEPSDASVVLDLPSSAVYPSDFESASGGIVRAVEMALSLAEGYLARIAFDAEGVVLVFEARSEDPVIPLADVGDRYVLGPDDKITIKIHNHPEHDTTVRVDRAGVVSAPLVGELQAAGLSPRELAARLTELIGRSYLVDPKISVGVEDYRSQWVLITGEVYATGRLPLRGGTRLKEVISEAGGFKDFAGREIVISRKTGGGDGFETLRIDRREFELGLSNPALRNEDIIEVPRAAFCYVQGEVRAPGRVLIEPGTTLLKALTMVGGTTEWADLGEVRVLYEAGHDPPERTYNLRKIRNGKEADPMLLGEEVIVIKRRFF